MERKVGIREAKAKLSHYIDLARRGEDIILTEHGTPVVRLVAVATGKPSEMDVLRELAEIGLVDPGDHLAELHQPIRPAKNVSISRLVREMRR